MNFHYFFALATALFCFALLQNEILAISIDAAYILLEIIHY